MEKTKLLFLPHCLKSKYLERLEKEGKKKDYKVYIVPGGSRVKKILKQYPKINKIIGIACKDEIKLALNYTKKLKENKTTIKAIKLSSDGCKNTEVSIKEILQAL